MKSTRSKPTPKKTSITSRKRPRVPAKPSKSVDVLRAEAYERLGVTEADVLVLPVITTVLTQLSGGIRKAIEFLRGSQDSDARRWLAVYDDIPEHQRKRLPFEAFCLAASLSTKRVLEVITGACFEQSSSASSLLAAASHPDVVKATIVSAMFHDGSADRKMLHLHSGFVPVPKNQTTIISGRVSQTNIQNNNSNNSNSLTISANEVPAIEDRMAKITNRFNTERLGLAASEDVQRQNALVESTEDDVHDVDGAHGADDIEIEAYDVSDTAYDV